MTTKKLFILISISISGVGLFTMYLNIFSKQSLDQIINTNTNPIANQNYNQTATETSNLSTKNNNSDLVLNSIKNNQINSTTPTTLDQKPNSNSENTNTYRDGKYTASSNYDVPKKIEKITVTIDLVNDTITNLEVQNSATRGDSFEYQQAFSAGISGKVIGKKLDSIDLSQVNGSSMTTEGFMSSLSEIKTQAKR